MISVLVADDHGIVREGLRRLLESEQDLKVAGEARDGREVLEQVDKHQPDVVVLDLTVPGGLGGKEVIERLLEIDPDVKAIVSSGYSNDPVMANFKTHGFCGAISKPYQLVELTRSINQLIELKTGTRK